MTYNHFMNISLYEMQDELNHNYLQHDQDAQLQLKIHNYHHL